MLDRLLHHAHIVQISGESYRLRDKDRTDSEEDGEDANPTRRAGSTTEGGSELPRR